MQWLQRHAWWGLLAIAALSAVRGLVDLATGVTWQAEDVTGSTTAEIAAQSSGGFELIDFVVRTQGLYLIAIGVLSVRFSSSPIDRPPLGLVGDVDVAGVRDRQFAVDAGLRCVGPAITGTIVGLVAAVILLVGAPRHLGRSERL